MLEGSTDAAVALPAGGRDPQAGGHPTRNPAASPHKVTSHDSRRPTRHQLADDVAWSSWWRSVGRMPISASRPPCPQRKLPADAIQLITSQGRDWLAGKAFLTAVRLIGRLCDAREPVNSR
jgi:hypothetical protein